MDGVFFLISCQTRPAAVVALRFGLEVDWDWTGATAWFELRRHILPSIPRNAAGRGALHFRGGWLGWTGSPGPGRSRGPAIRAALDLGWSRRKTFFLRRYSGRHHRRRERRDARAAQRSASEGDPARLNLQASGEAGGRATHCVALRCAALVRSHKSGGGRPRNRFGIATVLGYKLPFEGRSTVPLTACSCGFPPRERPGQVRAKQGPQGQSKLP